ncbi:hypothetical protein Bpfe_001504 [Biomphalaria pfeifferi]|uniref:Uncharacterized protein n=1 Tax=Biomphalaria pfeifferi TaxID=112525 RepID=A0AAD8CB28_BIOPF|nr:hypothetical protein Bpfe_001504 [Biomphalaria pfeifferi]
MTAWSSCDSIPHWVDYDKLKLSPSPPFPVDNGEHDLSPPGNFVLKVNNGLPPPIESPLYAYASLGTIITLHLLPTVSQRRLAAPLEASCQCTSTSALGRVIGGGTAGDVHAFHFTE